MPTSMSWKSPRRPAAGSSLAGADLGGELHVAVGQRGRVEGAVGGGKVRCSAVDDAVEAGRAAGAGGRPLEGPAGLQVALAGEDDEVLAEHVAAEGDGASLVVVAGGPATASAASAPAATRVLICIVNPSSGNRSLLEWQVAYSSYY